MKSRKNLLFALFTMMLLAMMSFTPQPSYALVTAGSTGTSVCPGSGERCARTKVLGIPIWLKKTKDGPGIEIEN